MPEAELLRRLTAIPGVGPWTANIYLLTAVGWSDAWPAADLALQEAARDLFGLAQRPQASLMDQLAEPWRPHRAAAALLLWSHYRELKGLPQA
jgi:DNA-3-methyladenine glycosylase II